MKEYNFSLSEEEWRSVAALGWKRVFILSNSIDKQQAEAVQLPLSLSPLLLIQPLTHSPRLRLSLQFFIILSPFSSCESFYVMLKIDTQRCEYMGNIKEKSCGERSERMGGGCWWVASLWTSESGRKLLRRTCVWFSSILASDSNGKKRISHILFHASNITLCRQYFVFALDLLSFLVSLHL
jgi:hypothetical protein